ncbi:MAG: transporter substrate-binding domain-containing protein [Hydrogenophaga sp.]|uniref:ATP-binding protein n=1 Tax=Hydrogenophaga sp. TaxID=1904254 RepID=UPI001D9D56BD|nr:transporter substrate-binding domain-containing protein [Hydrogenophaga sp.]MBX3610016.1 transporter substrate-binding domain-containing protein [Hydrogenophaga sp.]
MPTLSPGTPTDSSRANGALRRHVRWVSLALTLVCALTTVQARVLHYGGDEAFAPFESLDAQGQPVGFQIDLMRAVARELNAEADIQLQPWAATVEAFRAGRVDVVAMVQTIERRAYSRFLPGHAALDFAVYLPSGRTAPATLQDLDGHRIAVLDREPMRETLSRWMSGIRGPFVRTPDTLSALQAVQRGEADMALLLRAYADPLVASGKVAGVEAAPGSLSLQTYALAVAYDNEALFNELQGALARLEANGTLPALRERWLGQSPDVAMRVAFERDLREQQRWIWVLAGAALALLLGAAWALRYRARAHARERERRRRAEQSLQQAHDLLERTFARNTEPMLVIDHASGVVRDANPALIELLGEVEANVVGQPLRLLAHHVGLDNLKRMARAIDVRGEIDGLPASVTPVSGDPRPCLISAELMNVGDQRVVLCIVHDVSERLARDAVFRMAYEQLRIDVPSEPDTEPSPDVADQRVREFTRAVAHDLRAPLLAIQGFVSLLRERLTQGHTEEAIEYSDQVEKATRRMNSMIDALCELAQIDQRVQRRDPIDMDALVEETWRLVSASDRSRQVEMRHDPLPPARGDADLVAQVWQNLLHNAWKYTARSPHARVRVDSFELDGRVWYRVTDNGAGFDMNRARGLFQPFRRMHAKGQFEGTGVGLSMVLRIVRHHGGDVHLRSQPDVGTVAEFTLAPSRADHHGA